MHLSPVFVAGSMVLSFAGAGHTAPPPNANPAFSAWFESLIDPDTSVPCCSLSDCRMVEHRMARDHFEVEVEGQWVSIPEEKVLHRTDNPTGQAVLCWSKALGIMCFVPGAGT
jgi:hypothetical protein